MAYIMNTLYIEPLSEFSNKLLKQQKQLHFLFRSHKPIYGYLLAWSLVMLTKDSLYAVVLNNGWTIVIPGALVSEINRWPCRL